MLEFISPSGVAVVGTVISAFASSLTQISLAFRYDSIHGDALAFMGTVRRSSPKKIGSGRTIWVMPPTHRCEFEDRD
jgi:hypothetical protein